MEIIEVSPAYYGEIIPKPYQVFGSAGFNELNRDKCDTVHYLLFKDSKYRLGLVCGSREGNLWSPFSAPFGGFSFLHEDIRLVSIDAALVLLVEWARSHNLGEIHLTLPPAFYHESFIAKQVNCLYRNGFRIGSVDLNYAYDTRNFGEDYSGRIWYNARKNLKIAASQQFSFRVCDTPAEKQSAYEVIRQNRASRGFPLRMSWEQVEATLGRVQADFFLVKNPEGFSVASAIVFHVAPGTVQVIYWGDLPEFAQQKTMNFLSFQIFLHYHERNVDWVDIGPSTEHSIPNFGLCEFKESIGCTISSKFSFVKSLASI